MGGAEGRFFDSCWPTSCTRWRATIHSTVSRRGMRCSFSPPNRSGNHHRRLHSRDRHLDQGRPRAHRNYRAAGGSGRSRGSPPPLAGVYRTRAGGCSRVRDTLMKQSAGALLVSRRGRWARGAHRPSEWSVQPARRRGAFPRESPTPAKSLEDAARRETWEETGVRPGALMPLGSMQYTKSRKEVHAFAGPAPADAGRAAHRGRWTRRVSCRSTEARRLLHPEQAVFLDRLCELLEREA